MIFNFVWNAICVIVIVLAIFAMVAEIANTLWVIAAALERWCGPVWSRILVAVAAFTFCAALEHYTTKR